MKGYKLELPMPSGGFFKGIIDKGIEYYDNRRREGFNQYYASLYQGCTEEEVLEYERNIKTTEDDYYGLLQVAMNDEEQQKIPIYVNLYKSIRDGKVHQEEKMRYLKMLKNLPMSALDIVAKLYIYKNYNIKPTSGNFCDDVGRYLRAIDSTVTLKYEMSLLKQYGILIDVNGALDMKIEFDKLISFCFDSKILTPSYYGLDVWKSFVRVLSHDVFGEAHIDEINSISSKIDILVDNGGSFNNLGSTEGLSSIVCILDEESFKENVVSELKEQAEKVIKISFSDKVVDQLIDIDGEIINFTKNFEAAENKFLEELKKRAY